MDGSTLALVGDLDYIAFGEGPTDFSMQVLNHRDSQVEVRPKSVNAVSNGLQRSFSYAMEGTMVSREVDLYEVGDHTMRFIRVHYALTSFVLKVSNFDSKAV